MSEDIKDKLINLEINIIDTGVGISKSGIKKLFMNFGRLLKS